ncbi:MAG: hypothetical protein JSS02_13700 [Planctomycetes bacterium]|nr:hypothetical protein [Planctomycetota bacterium]
MFPFSVVEPTAGVAGRKPGGSGSSLHNAKSGSMCDLEELRARVTRLFPKRFLIPVELTLSTNLPVALYHSQDVTAAGCWYSQPLDLGDEIGDPAFWKLERTSKGHWELSVSRAGTVLARYELPSKSVEFPLVLTRVGAAQGARWPRTLTVGRPH